MTLSSSSSTSSSSSAPIFSNLHHRKKASLTMTDPQDQVALLKKPPPRSLDEYYEQSSSNDLNLKVSLAYWILFSSLGFANSGDSAELSHMNFVLSNEEFAQEILSGDLKGKGGILAASIFGGMLLGGLLTGAIGDHMGRKPTLLVGLGLNSSAGLLSALVPGFVTLCILRFLAGLGVGAILSSLVTLATETSPPSKRGRNVAFVGCFFTFGTVYVALIALWFYGGKSNSEKLLSWRIFVALCALPSFLGTAMVYFFVPESSRYLALQHRHAEATTVANQIAQAMGYRGKMLTQAEVQYHHSSNRPHNSSNNSKVSMALLKQKSIRAFANIQKLYTPDIYHKTLTLQMIWMTLSFGAGLSTWINVVLKQMQVSNLYQNALYYSLASIPGNLMAAYGMDRMGRKSLMIIGMLGSALSLLYFSQVASPSHITNSSSATSAIVCACLFHSFVVLGWGTVNVITSESFPTEVRGTGLGVCAASARMVAMVVQYVNGALVDKPHVLLRISSIAMLIGMVFSSFLNDMSFQPLKDQISGNTNENVKLEKEENGDVEMQG